MPAHGTRRFAAALAHRILRDRGVARHVLIAASCALLAVPAAAQQASEPDHATKAAMERRAAARTNLADALSRIAVKANDADALLDAGRASIDLEDYRAALRFLVRAQKLSPDSGPVNAAMGSAMVRMERPQKALDYFAQAQLQGAPERLFLSDRALAHDLLGEQQAAQRDYQMALSIAPDAETTRRYALSLGISGEADRAVTLLTGQLRDRDRSAWRTRAMILAMNGRNSEAIDIVNATMPAPLATSIIPYLVQMDRLTPAQQAAAAHFGRFPSGQQPPVRVAVAPPPPATPAPAPLATKQATPPPATRTPVKLAAVGPPQAATLPPQDVAAPVATGPRIRPGFSIASVGTEARNVPPAASPAPTTPAAIDDDDVQAFANAPAAAAPAPLASLADIVNSIEIPPEERAREKGALDAAALEKLLVENRRVRAAAAAREEKEAATAKVKAEAEAKVKAEAAAKKANPARAWVQIATGSPVSALAFDYRRFAKDHPANFKGQSGFTAEWNRTHRLLVGPFKNGKAADTWLAAYKKAGGDGFTFDSEAGEIVEPLK